MALKKKLEAMKVPLELKGGNSECWEDKFGNY